MHQTQSRSSKEESRPVRWWRISWRWWMWTMVFGLCMASIARISPGVVPNLANAARPWLLLCVDRTQAVGSSRISDPTCVGRKQISPRATRRESGWGVTQARIFPELVQTWTARDPTLSVLSEIRALFSRAGSFSGQELSLWWFHHLGRRRRHAPQEAQSWWRRYPSTSLLRIRYGSRVLPGPSWGQLAQRRVNSTATLAYYRSWRPKRGARWHPGSRSS